VPLEDVAACGAAMFRRGGFLVTNAFNEPHLEELYQWYAHRQRKRALIAVNVVDVLIKVALAGMWFWGWKQAAGPNPTSAPWDSTETNEAAVWSAIYVAANAALCALAKCTRFANRYLHWAAAATWLLFIAQGE